MDSGILGTAASVVRLKIGGNILCMHDDIPNLSSVLLCYKDSTKITIMEEERMKRQQMLLVWEGETGMARYFW